MSEKEELLFGLKRWIMKVNIYVGKYTMDKFIDDELVFDACCYCLEVINDISNRLVNTYKEIKEEYKNVDFDVLTSIRSKCFVNDNINLSYIFELCKNKLHLELENL